MNNTNTGAWFSSDKYFYSAPTSATTASPETTAYYMEECVRCLLRGWLLRSLPQAQASQGPDSLRFGSRDFPILSPNVMVK